jgi:hypothetical protein
MRPNNPRWVGRLARKLGRVARLAETPPPGAATKPERLLQATVAAVAASREAEAVVVAQAVVLAQAMAEPRRRVESTPRRPPPGVVPSHNTLAMIRPGYARLGKRTRSKLLAVAAVLVRKRGREAAPSCATGSLGPGGAFARSARGTGAAAARGSGNGAGMTVVRGPAIARPVRHPTATAEMILEKLALTLTSQIGTIER